MYTRTDTNTSVVITTVIIGSHFLKILLNAPFLHLKHTHTHTHACTHTNTHARTHTHTRCSQACTWICVRNTVTRELMECTNWHVSDFDWTIKHSGLFNFRCFTLYTAFDHYFFTSFFISIADLGTRPIGVTVLCTHTLLSLSLKLRDQYILTWDTIPPTSSIQRSGGYHSPPQYTLRQVSTALPLPGLLSSLASPL